MLTKRANEEWYHDERKLLLARMKEYLSGLLIPDLSNIIWEYTEPILELVAAVQDLVDHQDDKGDVKCVACWPGGEVRHCFLDLPGRDWFSIKQGFINLFVRPPRYWTLHLPKPLPLDQHLLFFRILPFQSKILTMSSVDDFEPFDPGYYTIWQRQTLAGFVAHKVDIPPPTY